MRVLALLLVLVGASACAGFEDEEPLRCVADHDTGSCPEGCVTLFGNRVDPDTLCVSPDRDVFLACLQPIHVRSGTTGCYARRGTIAITRGELFEEPYDQGWSGCPPEVDDAASAGTLGCRDAGTTSER